MDSISKIIEERIKSSQALRDYAKKELEASALKGKYIDVRVSVFLSPTVETRLTSSGEVIIDKFRVSLDFNYLKPGEEYYEPFHGLRDARVFNKEELVEICGEELFSNLPTPEDIEE